MKTRNFEQYRVREVALYLPLKDHRVFSIIVDAEEFTMGNFVQENLVEPIDEYLSLDVHPNLVLHPYNPAQYEGTIIGFEFNAVRMGNIQLQVKGVFCKSHTKCIIVVPFKSLRTVR